MKSDTGGNLRISGQCGDSVHWNAANCLAAYPVTVKFDYEPFYSPTKCGHLAHGAVCAANVLEYGSCECEVKDAQGNCKNPWTALVLDHAEQMQLAGTWDDNYSAMYNLNIEVQVFQYSSPINWTEVFGSDPLKLPDK